MIRVEVPPDDPLCVSVSFTIFAYRIPAGYVYGGVGFPTHMKIFLL